MTSLASSKVGRGLYSSYNIPGRKAHLLEDKQIPSVGVFDEVFLALGWHLEEIQVTWAHLEKKWTRLRTCTKIHQEVLFSERRDGVASIKQNRRDLSGDGVWILAMASQHSAKFDRFPVVRTRPAIRGWTSTLMRQRQKLELEEHVLGLFELYNEWTDVELQGNEGFIVVGSMVNSEKESFLQECLMKASENYRGDGKFFELHQKYAEVFKNPVEIGYFESSSDDGNDGDGIDDDGGNDGDGIDDDGGNDGGNGDADDDGENSDDVGHVFSKEFDKPPSDSS
ncbi:hypothetical protein Tco_0620435 [Tanacetum coccineum]